MSQLSFTSCGKNLRADPLSPDLVRIQDGREICRLFFLRDAAGLLSDFANCFFSHRVTNGLTPSPIPSPTFVPAAFSTAELKTTTSPMHAASTSCNGSNGFLRRGLRSSM